MTIQEQQRVAAEFAERWAGKGYEKGETQAFWLSLLRDVFGVQQPEDFIRFEAQVKLDHTSFIDGFIDETKVMIEQKSIDKDLRAPIKQSDGSLLSPFQQAKRYAAELPYSKRPRWIVTCNFAEFLVYDMEQPNGEPYHIALADLEKEYYRLQFLVDTGKAHLQRELEVSKKAGEIIGVIYDKLLERYINPTAPETLHSLNMLCVRLVFCLYAEDAGVFGSKQQFGDYIKRFEARDVRRALLDLFRVLDQKPAERDPYLDEELAAFPYVNGGLFSVEDTAIPQFTDEIKDLLCRKASDDFDWSEISPTIFGAIFESTLNPETRRSGGMHYTSIENIHKVIDPLFLNELHKEFETIQGEAASNRLPQKAIANRFSLLHDKIANLTFLDPACGSGNFLTETYISLRRLENKILQHLNKGQSVIGFNQELSPVKVSISQFYGIEINDFAVTVARTALWIAEHQMLRETQAIIAHDLDFLPLKSYNNIIEANALQVDWGTLTTSTSNTAGITPTGCDFIAQCETLGTDTTTNHHPEGVQVCKPIHFDYIMGNPPFVGYSLQTKEQKEAMLKIYVDEKGKPYKTAGKIDFVAAWYFKAAEYIHRGTVALDRSNPMQPCTLGDECTTKCAFVSTNSITQGEQVAAVWKPIMERFPIKIDFAYRTFRWDSESNAKAHVHCVIVGFSSLYNTLSPLQGHGENTQDTQRSLPLQGSVTLGYKVQPLQGNHVAEKLCTLFDESGNAKQVESINFYLMDAPNVFVESRAKALCDVPPMVYGNKPVDGGNLFIEEDEYEAFIRKEPAAQKFIRRIYGSEEYINNKTRYCLWLKGASPAELRKMPLVMERVNAVRDMRLASTKEATRRTAETPTLFQEIRQPNSEYIIVPRVSSESRRYVPIGFATPDIIVNDAVQIIPNATLYHFGVLTSNVHMAWMRAVCGRLEMRYRYSKDIVYNNFPWPCSTLALEGTKPTQMAALGGECTTKIEQTAQAILDARAKFPDCSLADLYDERFMPAELRKAHRENDRAVMQAYGFDLSITETECVAKLMQLYQDLTK